MKIYIITHKDGDLPAVDGYTPLLVGAYSKPELHKKYLCDDVGDNISIKNSSYCELTGLYWIWKNSKDQIIGLVHYRRFFAVVRAFKYKSRYFSFQPDKCYHFLSEEEVNSLLNKYDMIVKSSETFPYTNKEVFEKHLHVGIDNWARLEKIISQYAPEYYPTFREIYQRKWHINCNMFVGKRNIIDKYCDWLFQILYLMENDKIESDGRAYHNREMGFFAEILFGTWLEYNKINYIIHDAINLSKINIEDAVLSWFQFPIFFVKQCIPIELREAIVKYKRKRNGTL